MSYNKELITILAGKIINSIILLLTIRVLTQILSKEEVGYYYQFVTGAVFATSILIGPINSYYDVNILKANSYEVIKLNKLFGRYVIIGLLVCIAITLGLSVGKEIWEIAQILIISSLLYIVSTHANRRISNLNMYRKRLSYVKISVINSLACLGFGYTCVRTLGANYKSWMLGLAIGWMISLIITNFLEKETLSTKAINEKKNEREFIIPLVIASAIFWMQSQGYRLVTAYGFDVKQLGEIAIVVAIIAGVYGAVEAVINQQMIPILNSRALTSNSAKKEWEIYSAKIVEIITWVGIGILLYGEWIVKIITNYDGNSIKYIIYAVVISEYFRVLSGVMAQLIYLVDNTKELKRPAIYACIVVFCSLALSIVVNKIELVYFSLLVGNLTNFLFIRKSKIFSKIKYLNKNKIAMLVGFFLVNKIIINYTDEYNIIMTAEMIISSVVILYANKRNLKF